MLWIFVVLVLILFVLLFGATAVRQWFRGVVIAFFGLLIIILLARGVSELSWLEGIGLVAAIAAIICAPPLAKHLRRARPASVTDPTVPLPPSFLFEPERALIHAKRRRDRRSTVVESPTEAPAPPPPPSFAPQDHQLQPPVHPPWTPDLADDTDEDIDDVGWDDDDDDLDDETTLIDGMAKRVHLHYADAQGEATRRDVELQRVTAFRGAVYLEGYCQLRRGPRNFRLDRCLEIQDLETGEVFTPEELAEELGVTLHFSTDAA